MHKSAATSESVLSICELLIVVLFTCCRLIIVSTLTRCATRYAGIVAVVAVPVLKRTGSVGDALEWVFYAIFPIFCIIKALQDLLIKHQLSSTCSQIDEDSNVDRTTFCEMLHNNNQTNPCCPGELQDVSSLSTLQYSQNLKLHTVHFRCFYALSIRYVFFCVSVPYMAVLLL